MEISGIIKPGTYFMSGDIACAEGAIYAGCRFFAGYPITPATEIAECMSERLSGISGTFIQMEDEIASITAILGASWGGVKSMTATSGPGFSLMMENLGLGIMLETPCVVVDVQRAGPSTGLPTLVGQGDMMQARWGTHGPYEIIALCPSSPTEAFTLTIRAFNLSEKYRTPVLVMSDEVVGHMTEKVVIPDYDKLPIYPRRKTSKAPGEYLPFEPDADFVPPMADTGKGYFTHVTSLTHDERGYPDISAEAQNKLIGRLIKKIQANKNDIITYEEEGLEGADVVVCSYGISARTAKLPIQMARKKGLKIGFLRLITVWPFPEEKIRETAKNIKAFVVPEINNGQIALEVERCSAGKCKTVLVPNFGGSIHNPEDTFNAILRAAK